MSNAELIVTELIVTEGEITVGVNEEADAVTLTGHDTGSWVRGHIDLILTPGEAVRLSRALVKAASEALGVRV